MSDAKTVKPEAMILHLEPPVASTASTATGVDSTDDIFSKAPYLFSIADSGEKVLSRSSHSFAEDDKELNVAYRENEQLTLPKRIARIDAEQGGLLQVRHDRLGRKAEEDKKEESDKPTTETLVKLKEEMYWRLERNRLSLLSGWSLLGQILPLPPAGPNDPPPDLQFPHETFGTSMLDLPLVAKTPEERWSDAAMSLARRRADLKGAVERLRHASLALEASVQRNAKNWSVWLRWADRGHVQAASIEPHANFRDAAGVSRSAKNLLAYFGFEEAGERFRGSSYAGLDDEGNVVLHPRRKGRRRLVLKIRLSLSGAEHELAPAISTDTDLLAEARQEVFDEELFAQVSEEAKDNLVNRSPDSLAIDLPQGGLLTLSMIPIAELPDMSVASPLATLVASFLHLRMIALYRQRRTVIHPQAAAVPLSSVHAAKEEILAPTLSLIALHSRASRLLALMRTIARSLPKGDATVTFAPSTVREDVAPAAMGAVASLRLPNRYAVHARLSGDSPSISLDLVGGRRAVPANEAMLKPSLEFEVRRAYTIELGKRLGTAYQTDEVSGKVVGSKSFFQLHFDSTSGLDCLYGAKSYKRDESGRSLYEWAQEVSGT